MVGAEIWCQERFPSHEIDDDGCSYPVDKSADVLVSQIAEYYSSLQFIFARLRGGKKLNYVFILEEQLTAQRFAEDSKLNHFIRL